MLSSKVFKNYNKLLKCTWSRYKTNSERSIDLSD